MFHLCHIALLGVSYVKVTIVDTGEGEPVVTSTPFIPLSDTALFISIIMGLVGFILIGVSLFITKCRARWFFWYSMILSILLIPTLLGLISLIYLIIKRDEFKQPKVAEPEA